MATDLRAAALPVEVHVVERYAIMRAALRLLVESDDRFRVCGEHESCDALLLSTEPTECLVLVSCELDDRTSDAVADIAHLASLKARVLVLTGCVTEEVQLKALHLGAAGLVAKDQPASVLLKAIEKVHGGEAWFDRSTIAAVIASFATPDSASPGEGSRIASLTRREREVVVAVAHGLKNREIAQRLFISDATVRHHLTSVFGKLGVTDRVQLLIFAFRHGLAAPDG